MSSDEIITTIEDMERLYYSQEGQQFINQDELMSPFITKDAPVVTTTTGVYNAIYGAQAWVNLNMEANTFGVLPKIPWNRSGWRLITARSTTLGSQGTSEAGALPASIKPTFVEASCKPKTIPTVFEVSEVQEYLATQGGDDAIAQMADMRTYMATEHKEEINVELNVQNGTTANVSFESIDRIIGNYAELNTCTENDESTPYTAGDMDPYGSAATSAWNDRDAGASTGVDAYVSSNASTVRSLTDSILQTVLQNTLANGANPNGQFWQTGYDTWATINQLYDSQVRYNLIGTATVQPGVNGIKALAGSSVGLNVSTLFNKPVILSKDTVKDTGGISRIYLADISNPEGFDYPRLSIKTAKPTQYFEAGMNQGTPFAVNKFSTKGMYRTMGEVVCTFFKAQGKARDCKA
jgi:hypothetical protein